MGRGDYSLINNLKPLMPYEIRDIEREIKERQAQLRILESLVIVKSFKKGKCYGIGYNRDGDLILRNWVRLMQSAGKPFGAGIITVVMTDIAGAAKNAVVFNGTSACFFYPLPANSGSELAFGNPASPPTPLRTDYELASLVARFTPSATTIDETNWRVITTGSYVWTAGGTVRETGLSLRGNDTTSTIITVLIYHDAVSDVVVPPAGTLSVTYKTQY